MKCLSLFANIGVGNWLVKDKDIEIVIANELEQKRCEVYEKIYPKTKVICGDITNVEIAKNIIDKSKKQGVEIIFATPPCQGFSTLNVRGKENVHGKEKEIDSRNSLVFDFCKIVNQVNPKYVMLENVPQMVSGVINGQKIVDILLKKLKNYTFENGVLDAARFNTPQTRKRAIFLFTRNGEEKWKLPKGNDNQITLREAIGDFPSLEANEKSDIHPWHYAQKHSKSHIKWMKHTPTGKSAFDNKEYFPQVKDKKTGEIRPIKGFSNTYKRMDWDKPAPTLIKGASMLSSSNTVHPGNPLKDKNGKNTGCYSDARTLTIYEAMTIMGLPKDFPLPIDVGYRNAMCYLGEGICPKLVSALIDSLPK